MNFKDFKKQVAKKREQEETLKELNGAIARLKAKRDSYIEEAKQALKDDNQSQYNAKVALLKNAIFNLKQAQDMQANFTIAMDMCEMQNLNKRFIKSLNSVMSDVYKTCKQIHVSSSENAFMKALYKQNQTALELQQALQANNMTFASSVSTISDIDDSEISALIGDVNVDPAMEESLEALEARFLKTNKTDETEAVTPMVSTTSAGSTGERISSSANTSISRSDKENSLSNGSLKEQKPVVPAEKPQASAEVRAEESGERVRQNSEEKRENTKRPEDELLSGGAGEDGFVWDEIPTVCFDDIAGLEDVKKEVYVKVLLPLKNPEAFEGYGIKNGGGLCLYGPPGTGKTMIAAAIANEIGAKFCSIVPSDLLRQGVGNTERAVKSLFQQARKFPCAVIYFDEMDSLAPKSTKSQYARQLRSEFLAQLQGVDSYKEGSDNILFLICATNKPWDIDSAFLRPGRFGTRIYVGLPDDDARRYIVEKHLSKIRKMGKVEVNDDIDIDNVVAKTNGFNCSDISGLLAKVTGESALRGAEGGEKYIDNRDFIKALEEVHSSVQVEDLVKLNEWRSANDK